VTEPGTPRVAVYFDFDNIVISRYDQIHGRNSFQKDRTAGWHKTPGRLTAATVDVGAIIDFASSFGTLVLTKAYADWSSDVNADYRDQLVGRAVDLVQLFPAAAYATNGADIRLAVDAGFLGGRGGGRIGRFQRRRLDGGGRAVIRPGFAIPVALPRATVWVGVPTSGCGHKL
jgi:hypothetical protein